MPEEEKSVSLDAIMGDPQDWYKQFMFIDGNDVAIFSCPQCGAACLNPYQHKAWHIQFNQ